MILLLLILGVALIYGIARYNESNKLFWILFTCFVLGIAGGSVYQKIRLKQDKKNTTMVVNPTQGYNTASFYVTDVVESTDYSSKLVSKEIQPNYGNVKSCLSKCCVEPRTQPPTIFNPILCENILTHLEKNTDQFSTKKI